MEIHFTMSSRAKKHLCAINTLSLAPTLSSLNLHTHTQTHTHTHTITHTHTHTHTICVTGRGVGSPGVLAAAWRGLESRDSWVVICLALSPAETKGKEAMS